ncbi:MAG: helix-turn-helix domain-containing protein [Marinicellaceae bacterium]
MLSVLPYIYAAGAAQAFILAIALWTKKVNVLSNKVLAIWLLCLCFDLSIKTLFLGNNGKNINFTYYLIQFFPFLYASFFYIYVRTLTLNQKLNLKDTLHFLAFIIFLTLNFPAIFGISESRPVGLQYFNSVLYASSISYVTAGLVLIFKYRKNLLSQQVDIKKINLNWLMLMGYSQIIIWLIAVSQWLIPIKEYNEWTIYIAVSAWILLMGYLSHSQQTIYPLVSLKSPETIKSDERFDKVKEQIDTLVTIDLIHLKPNLSIGQLSKTSGYPEYLISLYINRVHGVNFYDFINKLRINHAKSLLTSKPKTTIIDVAYACGYNSKSTFNAAFKKHTNQTPSQFRHLHQ